MPERCPRCGSTHDSLDGVAVHAWKTCDDAHDDIDSKDEGMRVAVEEEYSADEQQPRDTHNDRDSKSRDDIETDDSSPNSGDPTVSGGPPQVPDDPDDSGETVVKTLSCGCDVTKEHTAEMTPGQSYRCSEHHTRFTYKNE